MDQIIGHLCHNLARRIAATAASGELSLAYTTLCACWACALELDATEIIQFWGRELVDFEKIFLVRGLLEISEVDR